MRRLYTVDEKQKGLMQNLGNAINESLSDSERIAEVIDQIKRAGYDVYLVLEATIGFCKHSDAEENGVKDTSPPIPATNGKGEIKLTSDDEKFLKELKIKLGEQKPRVEKRPNRFWG